jgi:succinyl-CoA synthetase alpha subunit
MTISGMHGIIIQGITGREARMVAEHSAAYGAPIAAGVTPGRFGQEVAGVPVFDTVPDALAESAGRIDTSLISVPPFAVLSAVTEAVEAGIQHLVIATEGVPRHDVVRSLALASAAGATVIGPNSVGVLTPSSRRKVGAIGGDAPQRAFVPGPVGIVSRSGGMTSEIGLTLRRAGIGVSTAVSIGGDELVGTPTAEAVRLLQVDPATKVVCVFGEPGTRFEEDLAAQIAAEVITVPVVALIAGGFSETLPEGTAFGHAAAMISDGAGKPSEKRRLLASSGAHIAGTLDQLAGAVAALLQEA